jgi:hypothetical protein
MPNRLASETSPYLRQHAENPVDWYPWGPEAFERARQEDKPILLSVGYSACHWCHVMERECFEDPAIAQLMNEHFVNVKVDREERPDVDQVYMEAVQAMTGHGGWPMTVFLTPEGVPFYGGTYFPPEPRHGLPGFPQVLRAIAAAWRERRAEILDTGRRLLAELGRAARLRTSVTLLTEEILLSALRGLSAQFDERFGGLHGAPKFPQPMIWEFVLRGWKRWGNPGAREMVRTTLTRMARGGIYDQLGGGFHRYAVDGRWLVPHFEKMLYDNAQLAMLYAQAWLAFGDPEYRRVCEETLAYLRREMTDPEGGFYSAQDADAEGEEGRFFTWTPAEVRAVLGPEAERALTYWGLDLGPNFEDRNVLWLPGEPDPEAMASARQRLWEARERRPHPGRDDKVLAGWNGLACRAFAFAGAALGRSDYLEAARRNAEFVRGRLWAQGRLRRAWTAGSAGGIGYLEDYALVASAWVELYEATLERRWLDEARQLTEDLLDLFWDEEAGGFFETSREHERLVVRPRNLFDNAVPSGSAAAIELLLRLALLTGEERYRERAVIALRPMADLMARHPAGFARFLCALDFHLGPVVEVALVAPAGNGFEPLLREVHARYLPNRVVAGAREGEAGAAAGLPLLEGRRALGGRATAYVCRGYVCDEPATDPSALARRLDRV